MRLIIGLGNPKVGLRNTRHNVGFFVVESLQKSKPKDFVLKKSDVYMNASGSFVKKIVDQYKLDLSNLYVIHDDLDIPLGLFKIQFAKGPKDHNGLNDIYNKLGTNEFWHVRVGIENRGFDKKEKGEDYVLDSFTEEEREILDRTIKEVCKKLATL